MATNYALMQEDLLFRYRVEFADARQLASHGSRLTGHVPKYWWAWLHSVGAYPLLGAYYLTAYRYKRMRLITRVYGIVDILV